MIAVIRITGFIKESTIKTRKTDLQIEDIHT